MDRIEPRAEAPLQNRILAALPEADFVRLLPELEPFPLPSGWTVHGAGRPQTHLYFITRGVVSRSSVTEDGKSAEFSTSGSEGVIGVSLCLGGSSVLSQAEVIVEGFAFRLGADLLFKQLGGHGALLELLLGYVQSVMSETGQIGACNRHHSLSQRLCRWLLLVLDRAPGNSVPVTHDKISQLLGARREGVTQVASKLQAQGLIACHRGHITVLDRHGLEASSCECYAVIRASHDHLLAARGNRLRLVSPRRGSSRAG